MIDETPVALGIDPDTRSTAVVLASELEVLRVFVVRAKDGDDDETAALRMVWALAPAFESIGQMAKVVVVEGQQIYTGRSAATPESILTLAHVTGACVAYANITIPEADIWIPRPAQWKAQVPKPIHQARTYQHFGWQVSAHKDYAYPSGCAEVSRVPGWHQTKQSDWKHLGDALGLALWGARRLKRLKAAGEPSTDRG